MGMRFGALSVLSVLTAGCTSPTAERQADLISQCEAHIKRKLRSPSGYAQISAMAAIPNEKSGYQEVFVTYDAPNAYNAPIRDLEICRFPYTEADRKIRPVTKFERKAVADSSSRESWLVPECCMPGPAPTSPEEQLDAKVDAAIAASKQRPVPAKPMVRAQPSYPYVNDDGVDIRDRQDEITYEKFGTTTPGGE